MEGNDLKIYENLCKIFEMRLKLDREKGISTDIEVINNYEKYAKRIDNIYNSKFQLEIKPLISSSLNLEDEKNRLTKIITLLEDRIRERDVLEDRFYSATDKYLKGLQPIVSDAELKEKKDRLETIDKYLNTSSEIASIMENLGKLENELASLEVKKNDYLTKNRIMEDELLNSFVSIIKEEEEYRDVSGEDITRLLVEVTDKTRETKETLDVTKESVNSLVSSGLADDYSSYVEEAEKSYYVWKNKEIILRIYDLVLDTYDEFKELLDKRNKIRDLLEERKSVRSDYHIETVDELLKFDSTLLEEIKILEEEKEVFEGISNCNNKIKYKKDRLKELENINNSVDVLSILREYGLIETYDVKDNLMVDDDINVQADDVVNEVIDPYRIVAVKDYPITFNIGLAKLKGESIRDKVNKKLNPKLDAVEGISKTNEILDEEKAPISEPMSIIQNNVATWEEEKGKVEMVSNEGVNSSSAWEIPIDASVQGVKEKVLEDEEITIQEKGPEIINAQNNANSFWTTASSAKMENGEFPNIEFPSYNNFASKQDNFGFPDMNSNN